MHDELMNRAIRRSGTEENTQNKFAVFIWRMIPNHRFTTMRPAIESLAESCIPSTHHLPFSIPQYGKATQEDVSTGAGRVSI